jgi:hypothetical protein
MTREKVRAQRRSRGCCQPAQLAGQRSRQQPWVRSTVTAPGAGAGARACQGWRRGARPLLAAGRSVSHRPEKGAFRLQTHGTLARLRQMGPAVTTLLQKPGLPGARLPWQPGGAPPVQTSSSICARRARARPRHTAALCFQLRILLLHLCDQDTPGQPDWRLDPMQPTRVRAGSSSPCTVHVRARLGVQPRAAGGAHLPRAAPPAAWPAGTPAAPPARARAAAPGQLTAAAPCVAGGCAPCCRTLLGARCGAAAGPAGAAPAPEERAPVRGLTLPVSATHAPVARCACPSAHKTCQVLAWRCAAMPSTYSSLMPTQRAAT